MFHSYGSSYVKQILPHYKAFPRCLLASVLDAYCHYIALTDRAITVEVLELKAQVLHGLDGEMRNAENDFDVRRILPLLSLFAPITCFYTAQYCAQKQLEQSLAK